jgi:hypothetical protein
MMIVRDERPWNKSNPNVDTFVQLSNRVELVLATYLKAHGMDGAARRLRHHVPCWPVKAQIALARLASRKAVGHE